ncbi:hypothetical protein [Erwinia phage Virsaitis27]|nr:hypothetical protein [Erwinia phage Virsaitis27]
MFLHPLKLNLPGAILLIQIFLLKVFTSPKNMILCFYRQNVETENKNESYRAYRI